MRLAIVPNFLGKWCLLAVCLACMPALAQKPDELKLLDGLPGFDFSSLTNASKRELLAVLTDEFDYCGRPLTLLASLKKGDACKHTKRLVGLAAMRAGDGVTSMEIINELSKYHQSFAAKRSKFPLDERTCTGPKDAKVTLVEFSDFECPYCAAARPLLEELVKAKPFVRLCWAPYPLPMHQHAILAGQAALFARDNGKFWPMHDALFENQLTISEATVKELAKKLGLDPAALMKAVTANKYTDELNASKEAGRNAGVDSTPSLYLNGRKLVLGLSADTFALAADDEADYVAGNNSWSGN